MVLVYLVLATRQDTVSEDIDVFAPAERDCEERNNGYPPSPPFMSPTGLKGRRIHMNLPHLDFARYAIRPLCLQDFPPTFI